MQDGIHGYLGVAVSSKLGLSWGNKRFVQTQPYVNSRGPWVAHVTVKLSPVGSKWKCSHSYHSVPCPVAAHLLSQECIRTGG